MQRLICEELKEAHILLTSDNPFDNHSPDETECDCNFNYKYMLPCRHLFVNDHLGVFELKDEILENMIDGFEENGFDVYFKREIAKNNRNSTATSSRTEFEDNLQNLERSCLEQFEQLQAKYFILI